MSVTYGALKIEQIPRLVVAYKNSYLETEGKGMSEIHQQNILSWVIGNFNNPEFYFLVACSGKKIIGFTILSPDYQLDGIKTVFCAGIFVEKDYRQHIEIAKTLFEMAASWAKKSGYKRAFAYEKEGDRTWDKKEEYGWKPIKTLLSREV